MHTARQHMKHVSFGALLPSFHIIPTLWGIPDFSYQALISETLFNEWQSKTPA